MAGISNNASAIKQISNLIYNEEEKDVTFTFEGFDVKIMAHKFLVKAVSPVLKEMLTESTEIKITDIHPNVFQWLINAIYLLNVPVSTIDLSTVADLSYAAFKFKIMDIYTSSANELFRRCTPENVHSLMGIAKRQNMPRLERACKNVFTLQTREVLKCWLLNVDSNDDFEKETFGICYREFIPFYIVFSSLDL
uniref:CSON001131 protein n=1 Tax=Culicoides sonorensis TaxID=179676 RepID=A0A336MLS2_CULSO